MEGKRSKLIAKMFHKSKVEFALFSGGETKSRCRHFDVQRERNL